ncbi:MAG: putative zinc-binding metallopeptidase [Porphyromonas sp.]|nr:putative zinc-binding metallopeptidase [Bacteroidales bacterium]MDD7559403.1 putative zinc-binding metallopeptidase [Bacteroidales bacterium]MDY3099946.1 putative zinc-binding metallopeptidase [Porphyromonas sp.]
MMNRFFYNRYTLSTLFAVALSAVVAGCSMDQPDGDTSVIKKPTTEKNAFDKWLQKNYVDAYNVDFKYRMEDNERDRSKQLVPATIQNSMKLASIFRHSWFGVYDEVAGAHFMRRLAPRVIHIIGSASWNNDGTIVLATAEGGLKVTIYRANWVDESNPEDLNEMFFKTMHHEFTHILHQNVKWPQEYNVISAGSYSPSSWHNRRDMSEYASLGFVTAYAGHSPSEDITELTACYITYSQAQWDAVFKAAGEEGSAKLRQKLEIMKGYMKDNWNIDMDVLRDVNNRRLHEIPQLNLIEPDWRPLFEQVQPPLAAPSVAARAAFYEAGNKAMEIQMRKENGSKTASHDLCYIATQLGDHLGHADEKGGVHVN